MNSQEFLSNENFQNINYKIDASTHNIIKVIGVGGGGCNAVANMYSQDVDGVTFVVCNTDDQVLKNSPISNQILMGEGLGAGNDPEAACKAAEDSIEEIKSMLIDNVSGEKNKDGSVKINTKMAFITAGMGGGTGTGAAPVIAEVCHELGILTVGIVTTPFDFEPPKKMQQALDGISKMSPFLDSLLIIRNDKIPQIFPEAPFSDFMRLADSVLANAAISIVEIVTKNGYINVDFADVYTTLKNGGSTIISFGEAEGEKRVTKAIQESLNTPLLFEYDTHKTRKILIAIYTSTSNQITAIETSEIKQFMQTLDDDVDFIWGAFLDDSLGDKVKITLIATCSDNSVMPSEIERQIYIQQSKETNNISMKISDLDDEDLLNYIQITPTYTR